MDIDDSCSTPHFEGFSQRMARDDFEGAELFHPSFRGVFTADNVSYETVKGCSTPHFEGFSQQTRIQMQTGWLFHPSFRGVFTAQTSALQNSSWLFHPSFRGVFTAFDTRKGIDF